MRSRVSRLTLPALLVLPLLAASYGGWATISVEDLPEYGIARQALNVTFTVRQHGVERMSGLKPHVEARGGAARVTLGAGAEPAGKPGTYAARLVLPEAGEWTISIQHGFGRGRVQLMPLTVVEPGAATPRALAAAARGQRLFVAKGCLTCHVHRDVPGSGTAPMGPDLSALRFPAEYLQRFLADPAAAKPSTRPMPNLELKEREIAALTAFINMERQASR